MKAKLTIVECRKREGKHTKRKVHDLLVTKNGRKIVLSLQGYSNRRGWVGGIKAMFEASYDWLYENEPGWLHKEFVRKFHE